MLYLSIALIAGGVLVFAYSLISLVAERRRDAVFVTRQQDDRRPEEASLRRGGRYKADPAARKISQPEGTGQSTRPPISDEDDYLPFSGGGDAPSEEIAAAAEPEPISDADALSEGGNIQRPSVRNHQEETATPGENTVSLEAEPVSYSEAEAEAASLALQPEDEPASNGDEHVFSAALFEDEAGILDFRRVGLEHGIDPEAYSGLKRAGKGALTVEGDGLSFRSGGRLYRYDFHRLQKIQSGDGYAAVFMKKNGAVRLFVFDEAARAGNYLEDRYDEYRSSR